MSRSVLITGALGNIGTKLRAHLAPLGYRLTLLDISGGEGVVAADIAVWDKRWAKAFEGIEVVVHLAASGAPQTPWGLAQRNNIAGTANVLRAARGAGAKRVVFASTNHVVGGYRYRTERLTTDIAPAPLHPYGMSKLMGEEMGRAFARETGGDFVALRIGYWQHGGNVPGPHMHDGVWGQQMWLSDRDGVQGMERAIEAQGVGFLVLNLVSDNPGMRWDIDATRAAIGYAPRDGHTTVVTDAVRAADEEGRATWRAHPYWFGA